MTLGRYIDSSQVYNKNIMRVSLHHLLTQGSGRGRNPVLATKMKSAGLPVFRISYSFALSTKIKKNTADLVSRVIKIYLFYLR